MPSQEEIARKYRKVAEFNGEDRPETGVHPASTGHVPTPEEALRLSYMNDETNTGVIGENAWNGGTYEFDG